MHALFFVCWQAFIIQSPTFWGFKMECIICGASLPEGSRFCFQCGVKCASVTDVPSQTNLDVFEGTSFQRKRILLPLRGGVQRIFLLSEILYFEREERITRIVTRSETVFTPLRLLELESHLPSQVFLRPHNSFLVNLYQVKRIERRTLFLMDGTCIPISNQRRAAFLDALHTFADCC